MNKQINKTKYRSSSLLQEGKHMIQVVQPIAFDAVARQLASFIVTSDSVVATAELVFDDSHIHVNINWGDGELDSINLFKLKNLSKPAESDLSPNTLRVQHVYKTPFDEGNRLITATSRDNQGRTSTDTAFITIEKRFRLNFFSVLLEFPHHLDNDFESFSEIESRLYAKHNDEKIFDKEWKFDVLTAPQIITGEPIRSYLDKSNFSREITISDEPVEIYFELQEADGIGDEGGLLNTIWDVITSPKYIFGLVPISNNPAYDDYDLPNPIEEYPLEIHPDISMNINFNYGVYRLPLDRGVVFVKFNYELNLIIPLDQGANQLMTVT